MSSRIWAAVVLIALVLDGAGVWADQRSAPSITGTWSGTFKTTNPPSDDPAHMMLKHSGKVLTGTAGPRPDRQWDISKGVVVQTRQGTTVTFDVATDRTPMHFELKLVEGRLTGTATAEMNGQKRTAIVEMHRTK